VLEGEVTVARASASQEVRDAWALFVAELLGNVTPTNADFLIKTQLTQGAGAGVVTVGVRNAGTSTVPANASVLLVLAALAVQSAGPPAPKGSVQDTLVRNLLTDTAPRSLGIEGLAARLERMEQHVDDVKVALAKPPDPPAVPPVDPAVVEAQRVESAL
jgi:hypothetical protein